MNMAGKLRQLLAEKDYIVTPGASNPLHARIVEKVGFDFVYMTGYGTSLTTLGVPDVGLLTETQMVDNAANIARAVNIPVIADADTGYGNAINVIRTIEDYERAGVAGVHLEDQVSPKRCGHFAGKDVVEASEMIGKIKAACDARRDKDLLIMARTDAAAVHGFNAAVERAQQYAEAGADLLFVEAVTELEHVRALPQRLSTPQLMNMVIGGKTPITSAQELGQLGYGLVLYANAALQGALAGMQRTLTQLRETQRIDEDPALVTPFAERQRLVGKGVWDGLEEKYLG